MSLFEASEESQSTDGDGLWQPECVRDRSTSSSVKSISWAKANCCADCFRPTASARSSFTARPAPAKRRSHICLLPRSKSAFRKLSAVGDGVKKLREVLTEAFDRLSATGRKTLLFVDEIHRFNKAQQDVLLPEVEHGVVILVGATTENPFFTINNALLSRSPSLSVRTAFGRRD